MFFFPRPGTNARNSSVMVDERIVSRKKKIYNESAFLFEVYTIPILGSAIVAVSGQEEHLSVFALLYTGIDTEYFIVIQAYNLIVGTVSDNDNVAPITQVSPSTDHS